MSQRQTKGYGGGHAESQAAQPGALASQRRIDARLKPNQERACVHITTLRQVHRIETTHCRSPGDATRLQSARLFSQRRPNATLHATRHGRKLPAPTPAAYLRQGNTEAGNGFKLCLLWRSRLALSVHLSVRRSVCLGLVWSGLVLSCLVLSCLVLSVSLSVSIRESAGLALAFVRFILWLVEAIVLHSCSCQVSD